MDAWTHKQTDNWQTVRLIVKYLLVKGENHLLATYSAKEIQYAGAQGQGVSFTRIFINS